MYNTPDSIRELVNALAELPSIGPRQATRLAFYLIGRGAQNTESLIRGLEALKKIKICERCFFPTLGSGPRPPAGVGVINDSVNKTLCEICSDKSRDPSVIMIVEKETDLISIENTGKFRGRYLVLGTIPKTGMLEEAQKLRLQNLKRFIEKELKGKAKEIILGFNPTNIGDFNATLIEQELKPLTEKLSRLGRGLPTGGEVEFADDETLGSAIKGRN
ncbi:MAG: toprim domain-containing protein [bacterium]|nr:toprim domain-containing protein [bacterium]